MSRFFETFKLMDGAIQNCAYHEGRIQKTRRDQYGLLSAIDLHAFIHEVPKMGTYRCKLIYDTQFDTLVYSPYQKRTFQCFKILESTIQYPYKSTDRSAIDALFAQRDDCDDIIISQHGLLKDTSIANIALFDGECWITPKYPLFYGTKRAQLLASKKIVEKEVSIKDIKNIASFAIMNALIGFEEIKDFSFKFD